MGGPYAELTKTNVVDLESTPTHKPWALDNPIPESTLTLCQSRLRLYPPVGLSIWPRSNQL
jgi:hypothetical protein